MKERFVQETSIKLEMITYLKSSSTEGEIGNKEVGDLRGSQVKDFVTCSENHSGVNLMAFGLYLPYVSLMEFNASFQQIFKLCDSFSWFLCLS